MFRTISSSMAVAALLLAAGQTAEAHGNGYHRYESSAYHHAAFHRKRHMPRWLWRKPGFRHWYRRSPLRFNYRLAWWQLYDEYRWERRYYRTRYGTRHRDYDRNARYWRDYEHRERRAKQRRRHRDDDD